MIAVTITVVHATALCAEAQGFRVDGVLFLVHPEPDARSAAVFAPLGEFRTGLGVDFELGYDVRQYGVTLSGGFAGIDVGEPFSRNGIGMGRQQGLYSSAGLAAHWRPPYPFGRWRANFSLGYVRSALDNVLLPGDSLPEFARSVGGSPPDTTRRPLGVHGAGVRFGVALGRKISARDFSGRMAVSIGVTLDALRLGRMSYDGREMPIPSAGTSLVPRLNLALLWSPQARPTQEGLRASQRSRTSVQRR